VEQAGDAARRVEVRWIPYPVDTTFALADPTDTDAAYRRGLVRLAGFSKAFPEKLDFTFDGEASPHVMAHFAREFEDYFLAAHKVVLLEGVPRVGKTTLLTRLVDGAPSDAPIFAVLSPATFADPQGAGERTGFALRTTDSPDDIPFARRRGAQDYELEGTAWLDVLPRLRDARLSGKILVIDEIGRLQSQVPGFVAEIQAILDDPAATLFASIGIDGSAVLDGFKAHPRTSHITLTETSRASVEHLISKEFIASLRTAAILTAGKESRG
jgi:nucleoside-triphosphatase THEP1